MKFNHSAEGSDEGDRMILLVLDGSAAADVTVTSVTPWVGGVGGLRRPSLASMRRCSSL